MADKKNDRYPFTYACDWLREAGVADSRSDASDWITREAEILSTDKSYIARTLADQYINYYSKLEELNASKENQLDHWRHVDGLHKKINKDTQ